MGVFVLVGGKKNLGDFVGTLGVTVVAGVHLVDWPSRGASFFGEGLKERSRRVTLRDATDEDSRSPGLVIRGKPEWFFEAVQAEIAKPLAYKVAGLPRL